jgi:hypothetical protein
MFRAIYNNELGMLDKFIDFWAATVGRLGSNPYVIGTDPLNEPFVVGNGLWDFLSIFRPGKKDHEQLEPLYEKLYNTTKDAGIMAFEEYPWPDAFGLAWGKHSLL